VNAALSECNMIRNSKVQVSKLSMRFGNLLVLDGIEFTVSEGEFLCVVGPTGCGKTTFLNLVSGLLTPTEGAVMINGERIHPKKHNLSFVFQEPSCLPWRTVYDDVKLGLEIKQRSLGLCDEEIKDQVNEMLTLVGLKEFAKYYPHQLSGGMKQRVAVARAFATKPDLLLMDEPFGQLDVKLRFHLEDELLKLWQKLRRTVVFVTHNIEEAVYLGERILVLTQKPTRVREEVDVKLPRPRDIADPNFVALRNRITELIRWW
jgi:ABC-type nitrate/sulfonate/bicarbonate transport system ATPase subunit